MRILVFLAVTCLSLSACSSWLGGNSAPPLPGKRISVLTRDRQIEPDPALQATPIRLPKPEPNADWPQPGGYSQHAMHHMVLGDALKRAWSTSIGSGSSDDAKLLTQPVVAEGFVFAMDTAGRVSAFDVRNGRRIWRAGVTPKNTSASLAGGGVAYEDGRLFVATPFGEVVALEAKDGRILWRKSVSAPMRGAPTVRAGRVFAISLDNQTHALAAADGRSLWSHQGVAESASLLGGNSPAADGDVVVSAYSSGEIYALRVETGQVLWQDSLTSLRRTDAVSFLTDIRGLPVIDRGRVFAIGNSDVLVGIDLRTGRRLWEREIGGIQTPWIAGDYLFVISNNSDLIALEAKTGRVQWLTSLQKWRDEERQRDRLIWSGPVLASDRLIATSSNSEAVAVSPYSGRILGKEKTSDAITIPPVIAQDTLFLLTIDGDLVAYR
jgi:outer membrane protein assembly factor BamB